MRRYFHPLLLLVALSQISLQACDNSRSFTPPFGCERLNDSLWIDKQPLMHLAYWEYLGWIMGTSGVYSAAFKAAFPDTRGDGPPLEELLSNDDTVLQHKTYFIEPSQMERPLQYVTLAQLSDYVAWRGDRVYENMLREKKILPPLSKKGRPGLFSVKNYLSGKYEVLPPDLKKLPDIPVYSLSPELQAALVQNPDAPITGEVRCICRYVKPAVFRQKLP